MNEIEFAERIRVDPAFFCSKVLGVSLWPLQIKIINSVKDNRVTAVRSCHGSGKTFLAAMAALWFLYTRPKSLVITTAPTNRQVEALLWKEINATFSRRQSVLGGKCLSKKLELDKDWFALGFAAREFADASKTATGFQGFHAESILTIVDEAAGVSKHIYDAIDGILSSSDSHLLSIGNPTDSAGEFGKAFRDPAYSKFHISAFDTPNFTEFGITVEDIRTGAWRDKIAGKKIPFPALVTPQWVADKIRPQKWGEDSPHWNAKVLGNFPEIGTDTLIPLSWIERAVEADLSLEKDAKLEAGVDVARFGNAETVIACKKGKQAWIERRMQAQDTMTTAGVVKAFINARQPKAVRVDEIGVGAGVLDALHADGYSGVVCGVNVGSAPSGSNEAEQFINLRAELYWQMRKLFENGEIQLVGDTGIEELSAQLASLKFKYQPRTGKIQIESKDDMAKRGLPSPDMADALCLACAGSYTSVRDVKIEFGEASDLVRESANW